MLYKHLPMAIGSFRALLNIFIQLSDFFANMVHDFFSNKPYNDQSSNQVIGLELGLSTVDCNPYWPFLDSSTDSSWILQLVDDQPSDQKRLKRTISVADSIATSDGSTINRSSSTSSLNSVPRQQFRDLIWTYSQRYLAAEAVEEAAAAMLKGEDGCRGDQDDGIADGIRLVQLLIACAEAVACRDRSHASVLLSELRANALVFGSSFQRVASCFVQGFTDRLALFQPLGAVGFVEPTMNVMDIAGSDEKEEALRLVYEICPHIQFGHFVANSSILEAFEGESFVHVVDLGMTLGLPRGPQWRQLIENLANRAGHPPHRLRITAVGLCVDKFQSIGDELKAYATTNGINLEFSVVECSLENLQPKDIKVFENEVLVVNSILQLHCVVKESRGALNSVLQIIHELSPKVLVLVEQDSSHNGPFFLGRFMEALNYYSAIFDSLDAMLPKYDTKRAKIEHFYFAEEIKNIVSCEGPARAETHEREDQWRRRMSRAGFQAAPIKMMNQAQKWLKNKKVCEGYTVVEGKGCLILGWKSKPIVATSCWKC